MRKPNLLFIFSDEQRFDTLGAYGNRSIQMPNLNRLAEDAIVFDQAYATQPLCSPSRATLLTGLYPHTTGCTDVNQGSRVPLPETIPTVPKLVNDPEYVTAYHGKWHLGDEIYAQHGFEEWRAIEDAYRRVYSEKRDRRDRSAYHHWLVGQGLRPENGDVFTRHEAASLPERFGKPAFLAEQASRFIRENRDNPFILYVSFMEPHSPFFSPRDDQYDPRSIPLPPTFETPPTADQPRKARWNVEHYRQHGVDNVPLKTEADWRALRARYYGLCSLIDTHAGRILDTLEECGLADDTVVVFTSDHGDMLGNHRMAEKFTMFEDVVRVPLLLRPPGWRGQARVRGPVSQIDLVPTLLDYMGATVPGHLQGRSLRPVIEDDRFARDDVFIQWHPMWIEKNYFATLKYGCEEIDDPRTAASIVDPIRSVVTLDNWKFNCSCSCGEHELYDLDADPYETTNLARRPEHRARLLDMLERIRAWQARTGDTQQLSRSLVRPVSDTGRVQSFG